MKVGNFDSKSADSISELEETDSLTSEDSTASFFEDGFEGPFAAFEIEKRGSPSEERDDRLIECADKVWDNDSGVAKLSALNIVSKISDPTKRNDWYGERALQSWILGNRELARSIACRMTPDQLSRFDEWLKKIVA